MTPKQLLKWCKARRGRAAALADKLGKSREFVRQMGNKDRPIPGDIAVLIPVAVAKIESDENDTHAAAVARITAGDKS